MAKYQTTPGSLPYSWKRDNPERVADAMARGFRFRSRPGAPPSPRNYKPIGVAPADSSGFTSNSSWNKFFRPSRQRMGLDTSAAPDASLAPPGTPAQPVAQPSAVESELQATGMTPSMTTPTAPLAAEDRYQQVIESNIQYFSRQGIAIPPPSAVTSAQSGTRFTSRYGRGSVRSASELTEDQTAARDQFKGMAQPPDVGSVIGLGDEDWWNYI